jgi:hypothetical protein
MLKGLNVATPFTALTVVGPERIPAAGFDPSATVTGAAKLGAGFPNASCTLTCTAGVIGAPAGVVVGCTVNASRLAGPGTMSNGVVAAAGSPVVVAVSV